jgi:hypothetical protein
MSAVGTITLTGKSGAKYSFSIYPRSTEFKPLGAIYVMAKEKDSSTYTLIYIGETGDASKRPFHQRIQALFLRRRLGPAPDVLILGAQIPLGL